MPVIVQSTTVSINTLVDDIIDCLVMFSSFTFTSNIGDVPIPASFVKSPFERPVLTLFTKLTPRGPQMVPAAPDFMFNP